ncbi:N-acetyltransferase, partial [Escherichia coli]
LIKRGSMMIFAVDGRVQIHDIFHALRGVMQESI